MLSQGQGKKIKTQEEANTIEKRIEIILVTPVLVPEKLMWKYAQETVKEQNTQMAGQPGGMCNRVREVSFG